MRKLFPITLVAILIALMVVVLLGLASSSPTAAQEPTPTPPEDTWTPGPPATKAPFPTATPVRPAGSTKSVDGRIELQARFPADWPWAGVHWQAVCTVVQWQDAWGAWHDVEGWRGSLDTVSTASDGAPSDGVIGHKTWWVAQEDLGKGPFRWVVYRCERDKRLAVSGPFYLPSSPGAVERVEVSLLLP